jgi:hypothetical protein
MTINRKMCRSDSTPRRIINHWSSLAGLSTYRSYLRPSMSLFYPKVCLVSWTQCVRTNSFSGCQRTSLEWMAQARTGLEDRHSINTASLSNYMNWEIYCTYFTWSRINCLCTQVLGDVQAYVNAAVASDSYVEPAPTASRSIIYRQLFEELKSPV